MYMYICYIYMYICYIYVDCRSDPPPNEREGAGAFTVWAYAAWSAPRGWLSKLIATYATYTRSTTYTCIYMCICYIYIVLHMHAVYIAVYTSAYVYMQYV
jgi:hypothetical protein